MGPGDKFWFGRQGTRLRDRKDWNLLILLIIDLTLSPQRPLRVMSATAARTSLRAFVMD